MRKSSRRLKAAVLLAGLLLSRAGARPAHADEARRAYHEVRLSGIGGSSIYVDGGKDKPGVPVLHNAAFQAAGGLQLHALHVGPVAMYEVDGVTTLQVGELNGKTDLSLNNGAAAMGGARLGPVFAMGGATLKLTASLSRRNAAYRETSVAFPAFAGLTFEGESGVRVLLGPVAQYKLGETAYGPGEALEAGGRVVIDQKNRSCLMGQIITTAAGKENRGITTEWSVLGQYRVWRELFLGANVSVGTTSDRANKDTEVSKVNALLTAGTAF